MVFVAFKALVYFSYCKSAGRLEKVCKCNKDALIYLWLDVKVVSVMDSDSLFLIFNRLTFYSEIHFGSVASQFVFCNEGVFSSIFRPNVLNNQRHTLFIFVQQSKSHRNVLTFGKTREIFYLNFILDLLIFTASFYCFSFMSPFNARLGVALNLQLQHGRTAHIDDGILLDNSQRRLLRFSKQLIHGSVNG